MTTELLCLTLSALLGFIHIMTQVMVPRFETPSVPYDPNRENLKELGPMGARAERALRNFLETYPLFIALVGAVVMSESADWMTAWGAILYVVARTIYLPLYIVGIAPIRSLIWSIGFVGLALLFAGALI